jgi:cysteinyl-tRNA synthetase
LKVEGETMSKTLGNYYTFRDLIAKGYSATAIRYLLLSVPYHKQLNFTFETLDGAERRLNACGDFRKRLVEANLQRRHQRFDLQEKAQKTSSRGF